MLQLCQLRVYSRVDVHVEEVGLLRILHAWHAVKEAVVHRLQPLKTPKGFPDTHE